MRIYLGVKRRLRALLLTWRPLALTRRSVRGRNNQILIGSAAQLIGARIDIVGDDNRVEIAPAAELNRVLIYIRGNGNRLHIGERCRVARNAEFWQEDNGTEICVGAATTIESAHLAATEDGSHIWIGAECMLAYDIDIRTGDSHAILDSNGRRTNPAAHVELGDRVWLAARAVILKSVVLGADTVVGTGSIVTRSPGESGVVLAGNPARVVRRGIRWRSDRHV